MKHRDFTECKRLSRARRSTARRCKPSGTRPNFRGFRGRTSGGFTLVEVLLAMVLTVMLMTGLMMVATSSMQDRRRLAERQQEAEPHWIDPVVRQIEADLLMGAAVSGPIPAEAGGQGTIFYILTQTPTPAPGNRTPGIDHGSGAGVPGVVSYRLVRSAHGGVLLREQRPLTRPAGTASAATQRPSVQVVAVGIESLRIGGVVLTAEDDGRHVPVSDRRGVAAFTLLVENRPVAMQPIAPQLQLTVAVSGYAAAEDFASDEPPRTYERTLLTQ